MSADILVYVAGPFTAPTREGVEANIRAAVDVGILVARIGCLPVIPHANTAHPMFEAVQPYPFWIAGTAALLRACHALVTVPRWEHSSGARGEVDISLLRGLPVFTDVDRLASWARRVRRAA